MPEPPPSTLDAESIVEIYGAPHFAVASLVTYRASFAELPVDVTFFLFDGVVDELMFAFPVVGKSEEELRRNADRVLKRLRVLYGPPLSIARAEGEYRIHLWGSDLGEIVHRAITGDDRLTHEIRARRTGGLE